MMLPVAVESETIVRLGAGAIWSHLPARAYAYEIRWHLLHLPARDGFVPGIRVKAVPESGVRPARRRARVGFSSSYTSARPCGWVGWEQAGNPVPVKVGVGRVNAITGGPWDVALPAQEQDYLVCPPQLWLDGIKSGSGHIRQFVAAPLGHGVTVEAQMTGADTFGGLVLTRQRQNWVLPLAVPSSKKFTRIPTAWIRGMRTTTAP